MAMDDPQRPRNVLHHNHNASFELSVTLVRINLKKHHKVIANLIIYNGKFI